MDIGQPGKSARAWAADIVSAWIDGRPTAPIVEQVPAQLRDLAATMARNACEAIKVHARSPLPVYEGNLRRFGATVERFKALRQK